MLIRLRMLKLSIGKGHQVIKQLCCSVAVLRYSGYRVRGVCALQSSSLNVCFMHNWLTYKHSILRLHMWITYKRSILESANTCTWFANEYILNVCFMHNWLSIWWIINALRISNSAWCNTLHANALYVCSSMREISLHVDSLWISCKQSLSPSLSFSLPHPYHNVT